MGLKPSAVTPESNGNSTQGCPVLVERTNALIQCGMLAVVCIVIMLWTSWQRKKGVNNLRVCSGILSECFQPELMISPIQSPCPNCTRSNKTPSELETAQRRESLSEPYTLKYESPESPESPESQPPSYSSSFVEISL
jgi:hypothetical protein